MIIVCSQEGLLCNRLFHLSHFMANAIEHDLALWYPFFNEYTGYFQNLTLEGALPPKISLESTALQRITLSVVGRIAPRYLPRPYFYKAIQAGVNLVELSDPHLISYARSKPLLASGWLFRDKKSFLKHSDFLRRTFAFHPKTVSDVGSVLNRIRTGPDDVVIGVHIRRGDYKRWQGGKYYFGDDVYETTINQLRQLMQRSGKNAFFVICSNDSSISTGSLSKLTNVTICRGTEIEDLCLFAQCDYLIGPPSTFTSWASFVGNVPVCFIKSPHDEVELSRFKCAEG